MVNDMVERVARAILEAMDPMDGLDGTAADRYAQAAITSMQGADFEEVAKRVLLDKEAMYAFRWLWNAADTEFVQVGYMSKFLSAMTKAMIGAAKEPTND